MASKSQSAAGTKPKSSNGSGLSTPAAVNIDRPVPSRPSSYPRRALVFVAGLAPQVITETLYALAVQEDPPFVPTEVHVITTAMGARQVRDALLSRPGGKFHALCEEYLQDQAPAFPEGNIHVIEADGRTLDDIDSPEDSTAAADAILSVVRELAADPTCAIHASIVGGRKSMSFLLGMNMSLLGRPQDRLSHVLINRPFENHRQFFYPPKVPVLLDAEGGKKVSTAEARVTLAHINVVWVFDGMGRHLLEKGSRYDELVQLLQLELTHPKIRIVPATCEVQIGTRRCSLQPQSMFLYLLMAMRRQALILEPGMSSAKPGAVVIREDWKCGFSGPIFESAQRRMGSYEFEPLTPKRFRENASNINRALTASFGARLAKRARVIGPTKDRLDAHYGLLAAEPDDLQIS